MKAIFSRLRLSQFRLTQFIALFCALNVVAQDENDEDYQIKPVQSANAVLEIKGFRDVDIHRAAVSAGASSKNIYFHKPVLALVPNQTPIGQWSPITHQVIKRKDGTFVKIRVLASSIALQTKAREIVATQDAEWLNQNNIDWSKLRILSWPTKRVSVRLVDSIDESIVFAEDKRRISTSNKDEWELYLKLLQPISDVQEALNGGNVKLQFALNYTGVKEVSGSASITIDQQSVDSLNSFVSSIQSKPRGPLFQDQYLAIRQKYSSFVVSVIALEDTDLKELLITDIDKKIFDLPEMIEIGTAADVTPTEVDEYLKPLMDTFVAENTDSTTTTNTNESKVSAKVGKDVFELTPGILSKFEEKHEVTFKETTTKNEYVPHSITARRMRTGWLDAVINSVSYAFLSKQKSQGFIWEDAISSDFTTTKVVEYLDLPGEAPWIGNPIGSAVFYLGAGESPPHGYVWLDQNGTFPKDAWVPEHLRGKQISQFGGRIPVGTFSENAVGEATDKANLDVKVNVKQANVGVTNWTNGSVATRHKFQHQDGGAPRERDALGWMTTGTYKHSYSLHFQKAAQPKYDKVTGVSASVEVKDPKQFPPHVKGRWMLKVR